MRDYDDEIDPPTKPVSFTIASAIWLFAGILLSLGFLANVVMLFILPDAAAKDVEESERAGQLCGTFVCGPLLAIIFLAMGIMGLMGKMPPVTLILSSIISTLMGLFYFCVAGVVLLMPAVLDQELKGRKGGGAPPEMAVVIFFVFVIMILVGLLFLIPAILGFVSSGRYREWYEAKDEPRERRRRRPRRNRDYDDDEDDDDDNRYRYR
jgi:hypothetical protein